jgi:sensor histidine kinase regulating citrate/malate metabolism
MSLIKGLIEQWEGEMNIKSENGKYFQMTILLPNENNKAELITN